jgi:hypothetical protein
MRRSLSLVLFLLGGCILLFGIAAVLQGTTLPPLPIVRTGSLETLTAKATEYSDLERAGYSFEDSGADPNKSGRRERSYSFQGSSGLSAVFRDVDYPTLVSISRELAFNIRLSVREGSSPTDIPEITPRLVAEAQKAVRYDAAVVAGLGYLATVGGPGVPPEALQAAVIDYLQRYRQPTTAVHEVCAGCGSREGFGDEYPGGPNMHTPLRYRWSGWEIAAIRHYLDGDGALTVQVTARLERSQP